MTRHAGQPYTGILSDLCAVFDALPSEIEQEDWYVLQDIIEYRNARAAVNAINDGDAGAKRLAESPEMGRVLRAMMQAQQGGPEHGDGR